MRIPQICDLIEEAHSIFDASSIFEIINLEKHDARAVLAKKYDNPTQESIERYIELVEQLKGFTR